MSLAGAGMVWASRVTLRACDGSDQPFPKPTRTPTGFAEGLSSVGQARPAGAARPIEPSPSVSPASTRNCRRRIGSTGDESVDLAVAEAPMTILFRHLVGIAAARPDLRPRRAVLH